MYYLKLYDENLLSFNMNNDFGLKITDINIINNNRQIFPIILQKEINEDTLADFVKSRVIPKNRAFVNNILESAGLNINDKKGIIDISKGLSLIDSYWIVQDKDLKFEDYNLFENDFSEVLSLVAFTGYSSKIQDLITSPEFTTNGALPKGWRRIENQVYLFKGGTDPIYSNTGYEPYSEFYISQIAKKMELDHIYYDLAKWRGNLASVCKIFTSKDISYIQIGDIIKTGGIEKVYEYILSLGFEKKFSDMILLDSLVINTDRHFGNFGLLRDNKTGKFVDFAPIFDNGEGLLSKGDINIFKDKKIFEEYINNENTNISYYGISYDKLVSRFCNKEDIEKLRKLLNFKFEKHEKYNLEDNRLKLLEEMIKERATRFIKIIEYKADEG
ncbi:MAG TPA: protein kinase [Clostridiales bacterium]|nr:protein kinase [Clostridiales bacterium]